MLEIQGVDHYVIVTSDVERSLAWYRDVLGLTAERYDEWKAGTAPFPSVRVNGGTVIDLVEGERGGKNIDHVCFTVAPTDLQALADSGAVEVVSGPGRRWGARGMGTSMYVLDPDDNVVELRHYGKS